MNVKEELRTRLFDKPSNGEYPCQVSRCFMIKVYEHIEKLEALVKEAYEEGHSDGWAEASRLHPRDTLALDWSDSHAKAELKGTDK